MSRRRCFLAISIACSLVLTTSGLAVTSPDSSKPIPGSLDPKQVSKEIKATLGPLLETIKNVSPQAGDTFNFCSPGDACNGNRECVIIGGSIPCTNPNQICVCQPPELTLCASTSDCEAGEKCADSRNSAIQFCVAAAAIKAVGFLRPAKKLPDPGPGLAFSTCNDDSDCSGDRSCFFPGGGFVPCPAGGTQCYCLSPSLPICLEQSDCPNRKEVCANSGNFVYPICVDKKSEKKLFSLERIPILKKGGFNWDPCDANSDCKGGRQCTTLSSVGDPCGGQQPCFCLVDGVEVCDNLDDCPQEEVCASTPLFNEPTCVSIAARQAYRSFSQIDAEGTCPVLISNDPPVRELIEPEMEVESSRIVGGRIISPNLLPYMVALKTAGGIFFCSGTLLSAQWVITAAHCLPTVGDKVAVLAPDANSGTDIAVTKVFAHPKFAITPEDFYFDIAILQLADSVPSGAQFMKLNKVKTIPADGSAVRALGYGKTVFEGPTDGVLRQVDVLTVNNKVCKKAYKLLTVANMVSRTLQICTNVVRGGCSSCQGDSGGPIIQYDSSGEPIHLGISSFGVRCSSPDFPGVYARTSALINWIRKNTPAVFTTN